MDTTPPTTIAGGWNTGWIDAEGELCRLIYFSRVAGRLTRADLKAILSSSQVNNSRIGVTGALSLNEQHFLQVLEGRRLNVNKLFSKIMADRRHKDVNIIVFTPVRERLFPAWSMLFVGDDPDTREACRRFCGTTTFRPERLTADMAGELVAFLAERARGMRVEPVPE